jgi:UDP-N-acetylglucosamine:LPS N-acetylglucosamine transferase
LKASSPTIVAVEMGYGHLRAAHTLAELFGTEITRMDLPPIAGPIERGAWKTTRQFYNVLSRASEFPMAGRVARSMLEKITEITPLPASGVKEPANLFTYLAEGLLCTLIGHKFRTAASKASQPILATYPVAALAASRVSPSPVFCLTTDTDLNRAWAPANSEQTSIVYFASVKRVAKRLRSFGVPAHKIHVTGFPLPAKLVAQAQSALRQRLHRLDPESAFYKQAPEAIIDLLKRSKTRSCLQPISITIAIGGAGAQTQQVAKIIESLKRQVDSRRTKLTLVAGMRHEVAEMLQRMVQSMGLGRHLGKGIDILYASDLKDYFKRFEDCLLNTDLLWTKPSELVFYAALGLPLLLAPPVGGQEHANRDWLLSHEAAIDAGDPSALGKHIESLLASGDFCRIAWNAYSRLDRNGAERIAEIIKNTYS